MTTTEKTIRAYGQWLKITRDNKNKTFTFARGYDGSFTASQIQTYKFKWMANWMEALTFANQTIESYK
jgi:hypothetical protein